MLEPLDDKLAIEMEMANASVGEVITVTKSNRQLCYRLMDKYNIQGKIRMNEDNPVALDVVIIIASNKGGMVRPQAATPKEVKPVSNQDKFKRDAFGNVKLTPVNQLICNFKSKRTYTGPVLWPSAEPFKGFPKGLTWKQFSYVIFEHKLNVVPFLEREIHGNHFNKDWYRPELPHSVIIADLRYNVCIDMKESLNAEHFIPNDENKAYLALLSGTEKEWEENVAVLQSDPIRPMTSEEIEERDNE